MANIFFLKATRVIEPVKSRKYLKKMDFLPFFKESVSGSGKPISLKLSLVTG